LLGVVAVVAESYERIHRSNLIGMGILPIQFQASNSIKSLGLTGAEVISILGISDDLEPQQEVTIQITNESGSSRQIQAIVRIDTPIEVEYYRHGGILDYVIRGLMK
jgi:aconitate hydratase